jgi:hypothetical protein
MLKNGTYASWFKTPLSQGAGVAHLADGQITGGDSIMTYSGTYEVHGDRITAVLKTKRHTEGHATVFGVDDLTLRLAGTCDGKIAKYTAVADEMPGVELEGTLILSEPEPEAPKPRPVQAADPAKLSRLPTPHR